jgi:hypothetical protein
MKTRQTEALDTALQIMEKQRLLLLTSDFPVTLKHVLLHEQLAVLTKHFYILNIEQLSERSFLNN